MFVTLSIIIVHYKAKKELFDALQSIKNSRTKYSYEVIIVDNDEHKTLKRDLYSKFPSFQYVPSHKNKGFGAGNNIGARLAQGKYLFFLNPDTKIIPGSINTLVSELQKNKKVGIVAPLLLDRNKKPYKLQGSRKLGFLQGIVLFSFINSIFPNNSVFQNYWITNWNRTTKKEVDTIPGSAFVIPTVLFKKIGLFDERFFLYFEENDICNRVIRAGYKIFLIPKAKVIHLWGVSTQHEKSKDRIFSMSKFSYYRKYYGIISAVFIYLLSSINKWTVVLISFLGFSFFLHTYKLDTFMGFTGDQGWFYLAARDLLETRIVPLVGITSSHTWLRQGPLWTYTLSLLFTLFHFNPLAPAYFTALMSVLTAGLMYVFGSTFFSKRYGIITALLYGTSPLIVMHARTPYHTSLIPFFTLLLLYCITKWVKGNRYFFIPTVFLLGVLYNLELATFTFFILVGILLMFGYIRKKAYVGSLFSPKILFYSFIVFLIPMIPFLIYDFSHGFVQTLGFLAWTMYKTLGIFGIGKESSHNFLETTLRLSAFLIDQCKRLLFAINSNVSILLFLLGMGTLIRSFSIQRKKEQIILLIIFLVLLLSFFAAGTPSEAYMPMFFPIVILISAFLFEYLFSKKRYQILGIIFLFLAVVGNSYSLISLFNHMEIQKDATYKRRLQIADRIVKETKDKEYNLLGKGPGSEFESFTMNYEYLLWWKGKSPQKKNAELQFFISELPGEVILYKGKEKLLLD